LGEKSFLEIFGKNWYLSYMSKKYLITERQLDLIKESEIETFIVSAIIIGGLYGLVDLLQRKTQDSLLRQQTANKKRLSVKDEQNILIKSFNLNKNQTISTSIPKLSNKKVEFEVYCNKETNKVGKFVFEIEQATYMISADPKNHLRSTMILIGKNLNNNQDQIVTLRSTGNDIHFTTIDKEARNNFGCGAYGLIYLYNKKLYETIVKDLYLPIVDFHISYDTPIKTDY
jgi:hypothetical protein